MTKIYGVILKPIDKQNPRLTLSFRMTPALAFLSHEEIEQALKLVVEEITGEVELLSLEKDMLQKLTYWHPISKTYIG